MMGTGPGAGDILADSLFIVCFALSNPYPFGQGFVLFSISLWSHTVNMLYVNTCSVILQITGESADSFVIKKMSHYKPDFQMLLH